jgi:carbon storage regulator
MLVLSRQRDETIMIGDDIEITIVDIRGDKVRLGITAPATIPVHRKEVYDAIQRENREAARVKMEDLGGLPRTAGRPTVTPGLHRIPAGLRIPAAAVTANYAATATPVNGSASTQSATPPCSATPVPPSSGAAPGGNTRAGTVTV